MNQKVIHVNSGKYLKDKIGLWNDDKITEINIIIQIEFISFQKYYIITTTVNMLF